VQARVAVINSVRFTLKSLGYRVSNPSSESFHKLVMDEVPQSVRALIAPGVASIAELTARIKALELSILRWPRNTHRRSPFSRSTGWDQSHRSILC
jgi:hypothetical protein